MTVLDAGANIGYFTTLASREVTRSGQVIAVEPDPYNFALLAANVRANRCRRVALIKKALGAEPGIAQLYRSERNYGDHRLYGGGASAGRSSISVPVVTVDSLAANLALSGVDVVKLDVQGFEHHVIRGMSKTISQNDNLLIVSEIWPFGLRQTGASPRGLVDDLLARGFALYALDGSSPRLIAPHRLSLLLSEWDAVAAAKDERFYINVAFAKGALMREIVAGRQEGL